jgi:hypothetical protein
VNGEDETPDSVLQEGELSARLGTVGPAGHRPSGTGEGQSISSDQERSGDGQRSPYAEKLGYHWGNRPSERVPHPREVESIEQELEEAFREGAPEKVWALSRQLVEIAKEAVMEAARSRFKVNFGTSRCERCEGLRAGPGVAATCFQVQQCHYDNVKQNDLTPKQSRVLKLFSGSDPT